VGCGGCRFLVHLLVSHLEYFCWSAHLTYFREQVLAPSAAREGASYLVSLLVCWFSCFSFSGAGQLLGWYGMRLSMMSEVVLKIYMQTPSKVILFPASLFNSSLRLYLVLQLQQVSSSFLFENSLHSAAANRCTMSFVLASKSHPPPIQCELHN